MPRIETYQASPVRPITAQSSTSDFANADGLKQTAQALEGASDIMFKVQRQNDTLDYTKRISQLQIDLMKDAETINNSELPEGKTIADAYEENFKQRIQGFKIPSSIRADVEMDIERMKSGFVEGGIREQARQAGIRARTDWEQSLTNAENIVAMNPAMAGAMQEQLMKAAGTLNLADADRDALAVNGQERILGAQAGAMAKSNPGSFIAQAKAGKWNSVPNLESYVSRAESQIKQYENESISSIESETRNVLNGFESSPEVDARIQRYKGSSNPKLAAAYQTYEVVRADVGAYKQMSPVEISAKINQELVPAAYKDGATDIERQRVQIAQKYLQSSVSAITSDTISYAVNNGVLPAGVTPLDLNEPATITSRVAAMKTAAEKYGYSTFTTEVERQQMSSMINSMKPQEKIQALGAIRQYAGDYAPKIISEITKESEIEMEYLGGMVGIDKAYEPTAAKAMAGLEIMKMDKSRAPSQEDVQTAFAFGDGLTALPPEVQVAVKNTAVAIYVGMGGSSAKGAIDRDMANIAVRRALGGIDGIEDTGVSDINGQQTYLPPKVTGKQMQGFFDALNGDDLPAFGLPKIKDRYGDVSVYDMKQSAKLILVESDGNKFSYEIVNSDDNDLPFLDGNGRNARITFTRGDIEKILSRK